MEVSHSTDDTTNGNCSVHIHNFYKSFPKLCRAHNTDLGPWKARSRFKRLLSQGSLGPRNRPPLFKGATSLVAGSLAVLDGTVIVLDRFLGGHSFTQHGWRWVRPYLVASPCKTHQHTGPTHLSPVSVMTDMFLRPCPAPVCFLGPGVAPLSVIQKGLLGPQRYISS